MLNLFTKQIPSVLNNIIMIELNLFSLLFCLVYSILSYKHSSIQELFLANLSFLLISGFFNDLVNYKLVKNMLINKVISTVSPPLGATTGLIRAGMVASQCTTVSGGIVAAADIMNAFHQQFGYRGNVLLP